MPQFLLFLFLLAGCGSKAVRFEREPGSVPRRTAILFVPGYYGSALADEDTGDRVFISAWTAAFGSAPLANVAPDLGVPGARKLRPDGVIEYLRVVPPFFSFDIYGATLDFLRDKFGQQADIVPFDYDWRQELSQSAKRLHGVVEKLRAEGVTRIALVAHSMGGLVTAYYLRYGAQDPLSAVETGEIVPEISAVVIGGTPFGGTAHAFRNLQHGTAVGLSKGPLRAVSLGTFPSMYQLLPPAGSDGYRDAAGNRLGAETFTPDFWRANRLGLFKKRGPATPEIQSRREAFVTAELGRAARFHERLRAPSKRKGRGPELLYLVGTGTPTFSHARWKPAAKSGEPGSWEYEADDESAFHADGDNTVTAASATPPKALLDSLPGKVVTAKAAHESIFNEDEFRAEVEAFLKRLLFDGRTVAHQQ